MMKNLLDLPHELLLHIIDYVPFFDIIPCSFTCRMLYLLAAARRSEHHARMMQYSDMAVGDFVDSHESLDRPLTHPISALYDFFADVQKRLYTTKLRITGFTNLQTRRLQPGDATPLALADSLIEDFEDEIRTSAYELGRIHLDNGSMTVWDLIKSGSSEAGATLLLHLLPNIESLELRGTFWQTLRNPVAQAWDCFLDAEIQSMPGGVPLFSALSTLKIGSEPWKQPGDFALIGYFLPIPTLRTIECRNLLRMRRPWVAGESTIMSNVTKFTVECSVIDSGQLRVYLERICALESFAYGHDGVGTGPLSLEWDPDITLDILHTYARTSLVRLAMTGKTSLRRRMQALRWTEPELNLTNTLGSFEALEFIRLEVTLLAVEVEGPYSPSSDYGPYEPSVDYKALVEVLPASTKRVELVGVFTEDIALSVFKGLPQLKGVRVPKLSVIVAEGVEAFASNTRRICKDVGISLRSYEMA